MSKDQPSSDGKATLDTSKDKSLTHGYKPTASVVRPNRPGTPPAPPTGQGGGSKAKTD